ncbi:hypothetical protein DNFV4_00229 [Nitrospira tepida]|uniref:Uncharacterized protein n=1 Tax=Nitrospira tepida TaxID=2973512 RepID=A0AA86T0Z2_9BACT|nr:hypothetical protein [Nitrospira tepida]CAI4029810.1 hypothetical protein DNFV4_00229 [Nitrospira tepida]
MLFCPVPKRIDYCTKLATVHWFDIEEIVSKGYGKWIELIEHINVGRRELQAIF